jgi:pimeloyl-ACP methyl ester carboxylesterase
MRPWPALAAYGREVKLQNGLCLYVYDAGPRDAPAIVLVHGLGDDADTWRHVVEPLAQAQRVVALDLPGFARSDKPRRAYTLDFFCATVLALLDALAIRRATLVGSSLGGMIAHTLAITNPDRVERLLLVDGGLVTRGQKLNPAMLLGLLPLVGERGYNRLRTDPQAAYESLRPYYADLDGLPETDRAFLFQRVNERVWNDAQRDAYLSALRQLPVWMMRRARALPAQLAQVKVPTRVVWGERDQILPIEQAQALIAAQPGAQLVRIAGAGHLPHQETPQAFLQAGSDFIGNTVLKI